MAARTRERAAPPHLAPRAVRAGAPEEACTEVVRAALPALRSLLALMPSSAPTPSSPVPDWRVSVSATSPLYARHLRRLRAAPSSRFRLFSRTRSASSSSAGIAAAAGPADNAAGAGPPAGTTATGMAKLLLQIFRSPCLCERGPRAALRCHSHSEKKVHNISFLDGCRFRGIHFLQETDD